MKPIDRLFMYFKAKGVRHTTLEKQLQLGNGYFSNMQKRNGSIGGDIIEKIVEKFPDLNVEWLLFGRGVMMHGEMHGTMHGIAESQNETIQKEGKKTVQYPTSEEQTYVNEDRAAYNKQNKVFFVDQAVSAGLEAGFSQEVVTGLQSVSIPWLGKGVFYVFTVRGDSMFPTLSNGDRVLSKQISSHEYLKSGEIYVCITDDSQLIKRYQKVKDDKVILCSDNEDMYPEPLKIDCNRIFGLFEVIEKSSSNLGKNTLDREKLKLYKALLDAHKITI